MSPEEARTHRQPDPRIRNVGNPKHRPEEPTARVTEPGTDAAGRAYFAPTPMPAQYRSRDQRKYLQTAPGRFRYRTALV